MNRGVRSLAPAGRPRLLPDRDVGTLTDRRNFSRAGKAGEFQFDVFLSASAKDKAVVRDVAARLQQDGVRVWLDQEQIKSGDSDPAKTEANQGHASGKRP